MANNLPIRRRRVQFTLAALFAVITLAAVGLYWPIRVHQAKRALVAYQGARASWEWDTISTEEMCEVAVNLYRAEVAVPFADRRKAASDHFERIEKIWNTAYGPFSEWRMGVANEKQYAEAVAQREKIKAYYKDAARLAGVELLEPIE